jgi:hypothetical protein
MDRLHVATLNIRNLADRWFERLYPRDHLGIATELEVG